MTTGKVYLVGAGPGDAELITVKGLRCIQEADVILYDRLVNEQLLTYAKPEAELIYCGKLPNFHALKQETINHFLVKYAKSGKVVTRLKGGDPFIFGRGGEEAESLVKVGIPFEVVPGVTSGIAAAAYAGIPLTHREYTGSVAFVTGHRQDEAEEEIKWDSLAKGIGTICVYMGISNLPYIQGQLLKYGKSASTPVAIVEWGTTAKQRTVVAKLGNIVEKATQAEIRNPAMVVIGEVASLSAKLAWFTPTELPQEAIL